MDKTQWGPGPWQDEPDLVEWWVRGTPCLAMRGPAGSWCGYVAVRRGHPWYLRDYDRVPLEPHGGLTFSGVRLKGDGWWWLGWDYGHLGDYLPMVAAVVAGMMTEWPELLPGRRDTYWPLGAVTEDIEAMARAVARLPVAVMSRRREAKMLARFRRGARRELVRAAGSAPRLILSGILEPGLDWRLMLARSTLRRIDHLPIKRVKVPRSIRCSL